MPDKKENTAATKHSEAKEEDLGTYFQKAVQFREDTSETDPYWLSSRPSTAATMALGWVVGA